MVQRITQNQRQGGFKVGTFNVSANGSKAVTSVGFTPKLVRLYCADTDSSSGVRLMDRMIYGRN
jgi:hypothetical protein